MNTEREALIAEMFEIEKIKLRLRASLKVVPLTMPAIAISISETIFEKEYEMKILDDRIVELGHKDLVDMKKRVLRISEQLDELEKRATELRK